MAKETGGPSPQPSEAALQAIANLRLEHHRGANNVQRFSNRLTRFFGQSAFVLVLTVAVVSWAMLNLALRRLGWAPPDPWPFPALQTIATVCAVYMTLFILIAQRRDDELSELREALTLQLVMLTEQRTAKLVGLVEELRRDLPIVPDRHDPVAEGLAEAADTGVVLEVLREQIVAGAAASAAADDRD